MYRMAILVPMHNTPAVLLRACLQSACRQVFPSDVLVFDDHSNPATVRMARLTIERELKRNKKTGQDRNMAVLQSDEYDKEQYPTAGHVFNEAFAYAKAAGYHMAGLIGSDDIILPAYTRDIAASWHNDGHDKLASIASSCYYQIGTDSRLRMPFMTKAGNVTGSPPMFIMKHWDYMYPEDRVKGIDYDFPLHFRGKGLELRQIKPIDYVYVFRPGQLSEDIHYKKAYDDYIKIKQFLGGKKYHPEILDAMNRSKEATPRPTNSKT